jgi:hypothetical protein
MPQIRRRELRRRRVRRKKLAALRNRYANAEDEAEKARMLKKMFNVAPWVAFEFRQKVEPAAAPADEIGRSRRRRSELVGKLRAPDRARKSTPTREDRILVGPQRRQPMPRKVRIQV